MPFTDGAYQFYIGRKRLPQTPSKFSISNSDNTEIFTNANGKPVTIPKLDGVKTYEFEFDITKRAYPFTFKQSLKPVKEFIDYLDSLKATQQSVILTIIRPDSHDSRIPVLLTDYSYEEDSENASDTRFSVTFVDYKEWPNQEIQKGIQHHLIRVKNARGWVGEVDTELLAEEDRINEAKKKAEEEAKKKAEEEATTASAGTDSSSSGGATDSRAQRLLEIARAELGNTRGSKYGPNAWCAWFVKWCAGQVGLWWPQGTGYCPTVYKDAHSAGRWTGSPQPGFYVLFDNDRNGNSDHIGIVEEVISSNHVKTIEGNHGKKVARVDRNGGGIQGYVNPF